MTGTEHRDGIIERWTKLAREKYDKGQAEHGGNLWEKPTLDAAIEESLDLPMYLFTLKDQLEYVKYFLDVAKIRIVDGQYGEALKNISDALSILNTGWFPPRKQGERWVTLHDRERELRPPITSEDQED